MVTDKQTNKQTNRHSVFINIDIYVYINPHKYMAMDSTALVWLYLVDYPAVEQGCKIIDASIANQFPCFTWGW